MTRATAKVIEFWSGARDIRDYCPANGIDDDGPGLTAALNSGFPIVGLGVELNVQTQASVDVASFGASLTGFVTRGGEVSPKGLRIKSALQNPLRVRCSQFRGENLTFVNLGTVKDDNFRAIVADREDTGINTDDIDIELENVKTLDYGILLRLNGRGLKMRNCDGGNTADLVLWSFPATGASGDPIQSDPILGSRAFTMYGCRLHNGNNLVRTTGAFALRGFDISHNELDLGDTVANGSFADGEFGPNTCRFSEGAEGAYFITGFGDNLSFNFGNTAGGTLLGAQAGATAIDFVTGAPVTGVTIKGLRARNFLRHAVSFSTSKAVRCIIEGVQGDTLGRDFINLQAGSEDVIIANCLGYNYGTDGTSRGFLRLTGQHDRLSVQNCRMLPVLGTAVNVAAITTPTINKSQIVNNISSKATLITGTITDGGLVQTPNILG